MQKSKQAMSIGPIRIGGGLALELAALQWDWGSCGHWIQCWIVEQIGGMGQLIHQLLHRLLHQLAVIAELAHFITSV